MLRRRITSLHLLATLSKTAQDASGLCCKVILLSHGPLLTHQDSQIFFAKLFFSQLVPTLFGWLDLLLLMGSTCHFPLLTFTMFLSAYFSSLSRSFWMKVHSSVTSIISLRFLSSLLAEDALCSIIHLINWDVKQCWPQDQCLEPNADDWLQLDFLILKVTLWVTQLGQFSIYLTVVHFGSIFKDCENWISVPGWNWLMNM